MKEMTSRERLLAAYARKPVDRIPCSPRVWAWMLEHYGKAGTSTLLQMADEFGFDPQVDVQVFPQVTGLSPNIRYNLPGVQISAEERQEGKMRVVRRIFKTPEGTLTDVTHVPPPGDRTYGIGPNPRRTEHLVKEKNDLKALRYLLLDKSNVSLEPYFETERQLGQRGLVSLGVMSQLCHRGGDAMAMTDLMVAFHQDRAFFDEILGLFQAEMMAEVDHAIQAGVKHFFANWYYNSMSVGWSPRIWREVFAPQLREMCDHVHAAGGTVNLYDDGKFMPVAEMMADAGIDVLQTLTPPPVGDCNLRELKRRIGDRVCLMGYVDLFYVIQRGTPELIDQTVKDAIEAGGPTGFILGTSDSIRDGTPLENVRAYFEAARSSG
jgi:uroporphyrinogen-III decarboxylase